MANSQTTYVHGYSDQESKRLLDQSHLLSSLFHKTTVFPDKSRVLEVGCGVGAQTVHLVKNNPSSRLVSIDLSLDSLRQAKSKVSNFRENHPVFMQANLFQLPFQSRSFDHIFVCFVLEHVANPVLALQTLYDLLKPNGTIHVIEGDHGSCFFEPDSPEARHVWNCLIEAQKRLGGDSLIGRRLYPLLHRAGFTNIEIHPHFIYADAGHPDWVEWFTVKTIIAMVDGVKQQALAIGLTDERRWKQGMEALWKTAEHPGGVFCYTFFQGTATR